MCRFCMDFRYPPASYGDIIADQTKPAYQNVQLFSPAKEIRLSLCGLQKQMLPTVLGKKETNPPPSMSVMGDMVIRRVDAGTFNNRR